MRQIKHSQSKFQLLTFDPDVAVSLEVVVSSFPGVPVVSQESNRWARPDWNVTNSFLIWRTEMSVQIKVQMVNTIIIIVMTSDGIRLRTDIFPGWRFASLSSAGDRPARGLLFICAVRLHHLALLCRNNMLLLAGLLPRGGSWDQISWGGGVQGGGLGGEGWSC